MTKEKFKFVFPNMVAKMMKKIDMRTQMESSMISMFLIMISMSLMCIYLVIFMDGLLYKTIIIFNLCCGFLFISSFLVTTYHQYISYMEMMGIDPDKHKEEIRKRGNIFKRIYLAIKNKRAKKQPTMVDDAVNRMIEIKTQELKDYKEIDKEAEKIKEELIEKDKLKENGIF